MRFHTSSGGETDPEGPDSQYLRLPVPKSSKAVVFGTRGLKHWVLGPSAFRCRQVIQNAQDQMSHEIGALEPNPDQKLCLSGANWVLSDIELGPRICVDQGCQICFSHQQIALLFQQCVC